MANAVQFLLVNQMKITSFNDTSVKSSLWHWPTW